MDKLLGSQGTAAWRYLIPLVGNSNDQGAKKTVVDTVKWRIAFLSELKIADGFQ